MLIFQYLTLKDVNLKALKSRKHYQARRSRGGFSPPHFFQNGAFFIKDDIHRMNLSEGQPPHFEICSAGPVYTRTPGTSNASQADKDPDFEDEGLYFH